MSNLLNGAIEKGKTVWLKNLLSKRLPLLPRNEEACLQWFEEIIESFESRGLIEPSQQKNYLTDVRNAIKAMDHNHPALNIVKFDKETWVEINNTDTDRIAERETQFLSNPQTVVERAIELINSYQWSEIAAGLAVVTGRRCSEVLKTAQFRYKTDYSVSFSGSLKRRGEVTLCVFEIPTLCQAELVIDSIKRLRSMLGEEIEYLSLRQISGRYSRAVAKKCDEHFADIVPKRTGKENLYTHLFRAVYATIASYWYCPPNVPEIEYRAAIQGHYQIMDEKNPNLRRSLAAGRNYFDYKVSDRQGNIDGRLGIKLSEEGVSIVSPFDRRGRKISKNSISTSTSSTTNSQIKANSKKSKKIMPESMNIPKYLMPRLNLLSEKLGTKDKDTLEALFDWAEVSLALADSLEIEELKTNVLYEEVEELKSQTRQESKSEKNQGESQETSLDLQNISDLVSSVRLLAEIVAKQNKVGEYKSSKKTYVYNSKKSSAVNEEDNLEEEDNQEEQELEQGFLSRSQEAEDAINHAIDKVMEYNEQEGIKHRDKFRVGIGCIRKLTGRGDQVIRRVIEGRQEEVDAHHKEHELGKTHNSKGKDAISINDLVILD